MGNKPCGSFTANVSPITQAGPKAGSHEPKRETDPTNQAPAEEPALRDAGGRPVSPEVGVINVCFD